MIIEIPKEISSSELNNHVNVINDIYLEEEGNVWPKDGTYSRTNNIELSELFAKERIVLARVDNEIAGSICLNKGQEKWSFGMLVTNPKFRKKGVGRALVDYSEKLALEAGIKTMSIELLFSVNDEMPFKNVLQNWYARIGYDFVKKMNFEDMYPEQGKLVNTPIYFEIRQKQLA